MLRLGLAHRNGLTETIDFPPRLLRTGCLARTFDLKKWLRFEFNGDFPDSVVLAQGMAFPLVGHQDAREVGMAFEDDAEHVVRLTLHEVGRRPHAHNRRNRRSFPRRHDVNGGAFLALW